MFYDPDSIYVVDNFLCLEHQDELEKIILTECKIPFHFNSTTNGNHKNQNPELISGGRYYDPYQFTHNIIKENDIISDWGLEVVNPFFQSFYQFFGCEDFDIFRGKINLNVPSHHRTRKIIEPHVDSRQKLWSLLYFVNDVPKSYFLVGKEMFDGQIKRKFSISRKNIKNRGIGRNP